MILAGFDDGDRTAATHARLGAVQRGASTAWSTVHLHATADLLFGKSDTVGMLETILSYTQPDQFSAVTLSLLLPQRRGSAARGPCELPTPLDGNLLSISRIINQYHIAQLKF